MFSHTFLLPRCLIYNTFVSSIQSCSNHVASYTIHLSVLFSPVQTTLHHIQYICQFYSVLFKPRCLIYNTFVSSIQSCSNHVASYTIHLSVLFSPVQTTLHHIQYICQFYSVLFKPRCLIYNTFVSSIQSCSNHVASYTIHLSVLFSPVQTTLHHIQYICQFYSVLFKPRCLIYNTFVSSIQSCSNHVASYTIHLSVLFSPVQTTLPHIQYICQFYSVLFKPRCLIYYTFVSCIQPCSNHVASYTIHLSVLFSPVQTTLHHIQYICQFYSVLFKPRCLIYYTFVSSIQPCSNHVASYTIHLLVLFSPVQTTLPHIQYICQFYSVLFKPRCIIYNTFVSSIQSCSNHVASYTIHWSVLFSPVQTTLHHILYICQLYSALFKPRCIIYYTFVSFIQSCSNHVASYTIHLSVLFSPVQTTLPHILYICQFYSALFKPRCIIYNTFASSIQSCSNHVASYTIHLSVLFSPVQTTLHHIQYNCQFYSVLFKPRCIIYYTFVSSIQSCSNHVASYTIHLSVLFSPVQTTLHHILYICQLYSALFKPRCIIYYTFVSFIQSCSNHVASYTIHLSVLFSPVQTTLPHILYICQFYSALFKPRCIIYNTFASSIQSCSNHVASYTIHFSVLFSPVQTTLYHIQYICQFYSVLFKPRCLIYNTFVSSIQSCSNHVASYTIHLSVVFSPVQTTLHHIQYICQFYSVLFKPRCIIYNTIVSSIQSCSNHVASYTIHLSVLFSPVQTTLPHIQYICQFYSVLFKPRCIIYYTFVSCIQPCSNHVASYTIHLSVLFSPVQTTLHHIQYICQFYSVLFKPRCLIYYTFVSSIQPCSNHVASYTIHLPVLFSCVQTTLPHIQYIFQFYSVLFKPRCIIYNTFVSSIQSCSNHVASYTIHLSVLFSPVQTTLHHIQYICQLYSALFKPRCIIYNTFVSSIQSCSNHVASYTIHLSVLFSPVKTTLHHIQYICQFYSVLFKPRYLIYNTFVSSIQSCSNHVASYTIHLSVLFSPVQTTLPHIQYICQLYSALFKPRCIIYNTFVSSIQSCSNHVASYTIHLSVLFSPVQTTLPHIQYICQFYSVLFKPRCLIYNTFVSSIQSCSNHVTSYTIHLSVLFSPVQTTLPHIQYICQFYSVLFKPRCLIYNTFVSSIQSCSNHVASYTIHLSVLFSPVQTTLHHIQYICQSYSVLFIPRPCRKTYFVNSVTSDKWQVTSVSRI